MTTPFDVLDAERPEDEYRDIITTFGFIEPRIDELDMFVALPVRLVDTDSGLALEIGPYTVHEKDIRRLALALRTYDRIAQ